MPLQISHEELAEDTLRHVGLAGPAAWWTLKGWRTELFVVLVLASVAIGLAAQFVQSPTQAKCSLAAPVLAASATAQPAQIICQAPAPDDSGRWTNLLIGIPATIAFLVGYWQWRAARHEASYEKFYDRLASANTLFSTYRLAVFDQMGSASSQAKEDAVSHHRTMFIFAELDNLEYILGKMDLRYVRKDLAVRALRSFIARCEEQDFRDDVRYWVGAGVTRAGYDARTRRTAQYVIDRFASPQTAQMPRAA